MPFLDEQGLQRSFSGIWSGMKEYVDGRSGSSSGVIPITKAEWDALTEEEREGKLYLITDVTIFPAPTVEEYDTEDGWHVRKWSDGYVEMVYQSSKSIGVSDWETWGESFKVPIVTNLVLPEHLTIRYSEQMTCPRAVSSAASEYEWAGIPYLNGMNEDGGHSLDWSFLRFTKPNVTIKVGYTLFITGRWK